ncbi:MAG: sigma-70 family RNA polymerase sigma factor [Deltaproteobacteria bacterium]|nr:sigma-70 family RNA polymerase sigma factor [Deltaproteobacteria bacterium]
MLEKKELERLVSGAKRMDTDALAELCACFYPQVYRFMLTRVPTREDAEDLAGEVCVRAVESLSKQRGFFPAWLYRIARNMVTDFYRRRRVRDRVESGYDEKKTGSVADPFNSNESILIEKDLEQAMDHLTPEQQEVIHLRFIEGYSTTEIAEIQGKSPGAIRALQFRAIETLRNLMASPTGGK